MKANRIGLLLTFLCFFLISKAQTETDTSGLIIKPTDKTTLKFGGAVWGNYAFQKWVSPDQGRKRGLRFDNLRLSFDGTHGDHLLFSAQYRIYGYTRVLHHAWFGVKPNENNQIELGITQVPFGLLPFATHSFWFGLGYNFAMEDDYDAGIKWHHKNNAWDLHLAFFLNEEYGDATCLDRYSVDLVRQGDQQNEEFAQWNLRLAYTAGESTDYRSEFGISAELGKIHNLETSKYGYHWQAAFHYGGRYKDWNPEFQIARYEYNPENPVGIDNQLILMGNLTSTRLVAAKGTLFNGNLRRFWDVNWGPIKRFNAYYNYSTVLKDDSSFKTSQLHDPGCVLEAGPFWMWIDFLIGKNAWYLNDSPENSGPGAGATDKWVYRFNISFEWYF